MCVVCVCVYTYNGAPGPEAPGRPPDHKCVSRAARDLAGALEAIQRLPEDSFGTPETAYDGPRMASKTPAMAPRRPKKPPRRPKRPPRGHPREPQEAKIVSFLSENVWAFIEFYLSGPLGGPLVALLGRLGGFLGRLGAILGILERSWAVLGACWALLGASWGPLGPSWGPLASGKSMRGSPGPSWKFEDLGHWP